MNSIFKLILIELFLCALWKFSARPADKEKIELAPIFGDNMVLQRDGPIVIWGKGTPGDRVRVSLGKTTTQAFVGNDGCWSAVIPPLKAGGPYNLTIGDYYKVILHDVYVGDVWLCAGQSNMAMPLVFTDQAEYKSALLDSQKRAQTICFFQVQKHIATEKASSVTGSWLPVNRATISDLSAVGYHFARELEQVSNVPIGIIQCAVSYLPIKTWISSESLGYTPRRVSDYTTSSLYNGMVSPLGGFAIKGVVWYQGESDIFNAGKYKELLTTLIHDWREVWERSLPFLIVQLPGCSHLDSIPKESPWAELREAQYQVSKTVPNVYLIVSIDTAGRNADLHPPFKQEIGHRLAITALSEIYKLREPFKVPYYRSITIKGNKVEVAFSSKDARLANVKKVEGLAIAGEDRIFYWADGSVKDKKTVTVSAPQVSHPVEVRYAWGDNPGGNLYSSDGLPIAPFRSDAWQFWSRKKTETNFESR